MIEINIIDEVKKKKKRSDNIYTLYSISIEM